MHGVSTHLHVLTSSVKHPCVSQAPPGWTDSRSDAGIGRWRRMLPRLVPQLVGRQ